MSHPQARRAVNGQLPDAPYSDVEWIDRIRASDVQAFEALVLHYSKKLCGFVFHSLGDAEATRELVQDLFFWVWHNRHEWEIRGGLTSYLYRSARNRAISHARHARIERDWRQQLNHEPLKRSSHADSDIEVEDLRAAFGRALESLSERPRQVFAPPRASPHLLPDRRGPGHLAQHGRGTHDPRALGTPNPTQRLAPVAFQKVR